MAIPYQEALQRIQTNISPLHVKQSLPLLEAINRVNTEDISAHFPLPKHAMSLKEGYGIALSSTSTHYTILKAPYPTPIPMGKGVKVSTGSSLPEGINAVVAEEDVMHLSEESITIPLHVMAYQHIKQAGEDITQGELLLKKRERLTSQKITALASQGIENITVFRKPNVSILSIGNQLASGEIYNSNAMSLAARVIELGGEINTIEMCEEDACKILNRLKAWVGTTDCIITTGAMSPSDAMHHLLITKELDALFHYVCITPSRPSALSLLEKTPILHLPGLPLGCMLGFEMLGVPLLRHLQNKPSLLPDYRLCINQKRITCKDNCMSAIPGYSDGKSFVNAPYYEAGRLNILSQCNGYTLIENQEVVEEGEEIPFFYFTQPPVS